jgi:hypothetical protein
MDLQQDRLYDFGDLWERTQDKKPGHKVRV